MAGKTYKEMQSELDELLNWFESTDIDLDQATEKYELAKKLISKMEMYLETAQNKIQNINSKAKHS